MTLPDPIRSLLTIALAAWMSLCCCEKRILAHAFDAKDRPAESCCAKHCCAGEGSGSGSGSNSAPGHDDTAHRPGNCADGCCMKGALAAPAFVPDIDLVGAPLHPAAEPRIVVAEPGARMLSHEDRSVGEPPPRLALMISRRLRI